MKRVGPDLRSVLVGACLALVVNVSCRKPPSSGAVATHIVDAGATAVSSLARMTPLMLPPAPVSPKPATPPNPTEAGTCPVVGEESAHLGLVVSPLRASQGAPLRILSATLDGTEPLALRIETANGEPVRADVVARGGTPAMATARLIPDRVGELRVVVGRGGQSLRCITVHVFAHAAPARARKAREGAVWPVARNWNAAEEALYSAWIREMFHAERGEELAFGRLDEVTANPDRNVLFDHFGWAEDSSKMGIKLKPDCADTPYFMRAYFAWKRALPFVYRHCTSGDETTPPRCGKARSILEPPDLPNKLPNDWNEVAQVARFFSRSLTEVHTGNGRVAFGDGENDFYGVELSRKSLRPGVIFADPYGHVLSLVEFVDPEASLPGVLYAVDGQPDGSITRKRFWEGNFLWNSDPAFGGSGFKAFRPLAVKYEEGKQIVVSLTDAEIAQHPDYGDVSTLQTKLDAHRFYDAMDVLITPTVRDPFAAQAEMVRALLEAAKVRVTSVNNAEPYFAEHPLQIIPMPEGADIFETNGPWEDFSTPSRDFRLLIAMDVVNHFDEKVARQPEAFGAARGAAFDELRTRLDQERSRLLASDDLAFSYQRSDGSPQKLTLSDLIARAPAFEAAYNPNDCAEYRWGAAPGSDELSTCRRRTPDDQRVRMETYRVWFHERKHAPRPRPVVDAAR